MNNKWLTTKAVFSKCQQYRYMLLRKLSEGDKTCMFLMLNPSTADQVKNDPTVERCERYARRWGYDNLVVCNLFALRSADPKKLYAHPDPVGPNNDRYILEHAKKADLIICAWGVHGEFNERSLAVIRLLHGLPLKCLGTTKHGHPRHPLYLRADVEPKPLTPGRWR